MDIIAQDGAKILITTPDYLPRLGGLSTFTLQLEKILRKMNIPYDLCIWHDVSKLKANKKHLKNYETVFHVQSIGGFFMDYKANRTINFVHGSEVLFHSPNLIKKIVKKFIKNKFFHFMKQSYFNIFISDFTLNTMKEQGYAIAYDRDLVFHNCTDTSSSVLLKKTLHDNEWHFVCVARDVPHKNIEGVKRLCHSAFKTTGKNIKLYVTAPISPIAGVEVINISGATNEELSEYYKQAHFNVLLSLDHRKRGFFEGFGLTVLEAGLFGTPSIVSSYGGLPEAVHHRQTGWVLNSVENEEMSVFWQEFDESAYEEIRRNVYDHTLSTHSLDHYQKIIERCLL